MRDGAFSGSALDFLSVLGLVCGIGPIGGHAMLGAGMADLEYKRSDPALRPGGWPSRAHSHKYHDGGGQYLDRSR
jgi:hypothetical protein